MSYNGTIEVTCSDADFYQRKIMRLEDDIGLLHEELAKHRAKLRIAEDFEIKYNILLKTSETEIKKLKQAKEEKEEDKVQNKVKEVLKEKELKWQQQEIKLQQTIRSQVEKEMKQLREQRDQYKRRLDEGSIKKEQFQTLNLKIKKLEKQNESWQQEIQNVKIYYERVKEQELFSQKANLNASFKDRMTNERKMYEQKICALQKRLIDKEVDKDNEIFKLPSSSNSQLITIKHIFEQKNGQNDKQLKELYHLLDEKNCQIKKLLDIQLQKDLRNEHNLREKDQQIENLSEKLQQKQRQFQSQLIEALNKSDELRNQTIHVYEQQIQDLRLQKQQQNQSWSQRFINHQKEIKNLSNKFQLQIHNLQEDKSELKKKIADLFQRLRQYEQDHQAGQTQNLIISLKDIDKKQIHMANYEYGVTFLERQLKKCQAKLDQKLRAISHLERQKNNIRIQTQNQVTQMFQKIIALKKQHASKQTELQAQLLNLNQELAKKQKQIKRMQRQLITQKHQGQIQIKKLKDLVEQVQKDYQRLIENKKQVENNYRTQRQRALGGICDLNINKKHKWMELERQKKQLENVYRLKQQQLRLKFQVEIVSKTNQLNHCTHEYEVAKKQVELLKNQNERLKSQLQENKQNVRTYDFQAKIATIDLQLALTQNIYNNLIKAKNKHKNLSPKEITFSQQRQEAEQQQVSRQYPWMSNVEVFQDK